MPLEEILKGKLPSPKTNIQSKSKRRPSQNPRLRKTDISYSAPMIAIRQVTQLNGKKSTGMKSSTYKLRTISTGNKASSTSKRQHQGLREVTILKSDVKVKMLKIPRITDRVW